MIHDLNQFGLHVKAKATSTLNNMKKADLIKYIRELEHNYNMTVDFNEQQARNIEAMLKEKRDEDRTNMKVYIVMEDAGYEGDNDVTILGVFSTEEKAKEEFKFRIESTKINMDKDWECDEMDNNFWSWEKYRMSRNWIHIWIAEEKVK